MEAHGIEFPVAIRRCDRAQFRIHHVAFLGQRRALVSPKFDQCDNRVWWAGKVYRCCLPQWAPRVHPHTFGNVSGDVAMQCKLFKNSMHSHRIGYQFFKCETFAHPVHPGGGSQSFVSQLVSSMSPWCGSTKPSMPPALLNVASSSVTQTSWNS